MKLLLLFIVALVVASNPIVISLKEKLDADKLKNPLTGESLKSMDWIASGRLVVSELQRIAEISQRNIVDFLVKNNVKFTAYWVANCIVIHDPSVKLIEWLKSRDEIESVSIGQTITLPEEDQGAVDLTGKKGNEWNVEWVKAPAAWAKGFKGQNVVVAELDTGCNVAHPDLAPKYRGTGGSHDYNWYDGVVAKGCEDEPCDKHGHGTHVMGTIVGSSDDLNVGMAPEAKFMSCRSFATGGAGIEDIMNCFQWYLNPTKRDGTEPNPDMRPHVINHSWGGGSPINEFLEAVKNLHAAKVLNVFAAGNSGSRCSSLGYPGAFEEPLTVAALAEKSDKIVYFSSRGPVKGKKYVKPDVSAPGQNINSCDSSGSGYRKMSGTSMATPATVGSVALLWSQKPELKGNIAGTIDAMRKCCRNIKSKECSSKQEVPNNVYGYGAVDCTKF